MAKTVRNLISEEQLYEKLQALSALAAIEMERHAELLERGHLSDAMYHGSNAFVHLRDAYEAYEAFQQERPKTLRNRLEAIDETLGAERRKWRTERLKSSAKLLKRPNNGPLVDGGVYFTKSHELEQQRALKKAQASVD